MLADDAAGVAAIAARLAAEAGGEGAVAQGQRLQGQDLVPVEVGDGHFRGGDQVEGALAVGRLEQVLLELGQLPGAVHAVGVHQVGRDHLAVARRGLPVQHKADEGPLQLGAEAFQHGEARAAQLGGPVQIEDAQGRPQLHVVLGRGEGGRGAPALDLPVGVLVPAGGDAGVGRVGQGGKEVPEGGLQFPLRGLQGLEPVAHLPLLGDEGVRVLLGPLEAAHLVAHAVPLGLEGLGLLERGATAGVQVQVAGPVQGVAPVGQASGHGVEVVAEEVGVDHGGVLSPPW